MVALFMDIVGAERPVTGKAMLHAAGDVDGVRRAVCGIDQVGGSAGGVTGNAAGVLRAARVGDGIDATAGRGVDGLEGSCPAVLSEVVEVEAKAAAKQGCAAAAGGIGQADARSDLLAIVVRRSFDEGNVEGGESEGTGVVGLRAAGAVEQAIGRGVAQAVVEGEAMGETPGIFSVESHALNILGESAA